MKTLPAFGHLPLTGQVKQILMVVVFCSVFLSSCGSSVKTETTVSKTGTLTIKSGEEYLLKTDDGIVNMTSNKVNLDSYMKKKITVTGQFSGSTLYVDSITN